MGTIYVCDICGKQLGYTPAPLTVHIDDELENCYSKVDLCIDCAREFHKVMKKFIDSKDKKEGVINESERATRVNS